MGYTHGTKWTLEKIEEDIQEVIKFLQIETMPTSTVLKNMGLGALHSQICRTRNGYRGWADHLNLKLTDCETRMGQLYEDLAKRIIEEKEYKVEKMTTKHPYDLLVNDNIKIDIKSAKPFFIKGDRVHTFGINKRNPTCDIYVCIALDEKENIERLLIIPSKDLKIVTLCIGKKSKYNTYVDRWDYLDKFDKFYKAIS